MTDRRYGRNKYGDGKLYGSSDNLTNLAWDVSFDWDGDGVFESNEALYLKNVKVERGRDKFVNENGRGFKEIPTGRAVLTFNNYDRRYDAWNTSSPIYPYVNYGVEVRIRVRKLGSDTLYPIMRGVVAGISASGYGQRPTVTFTIQDGLSFFRNTNSRVVLQENIAVEDAVQAVVDGCNYPWGGTYDTSTETINYWWSSGNTLAMTELEKLVTSFLGYFFVDRENKATFIARATPKDVVATFEQEDLLKDVFNPQSYDLYRNVVRLKVHPKDVSATTAIFQLSEVPSIASGEDLIIWVDYSYNGKSVPAKNVVTPVATTDYLLNTQSDGGGTNLTSSVTLTFYDFGDTAKCIIHNGSGSLGYLTLFKVRGDAIYSTDTADVTYPQDIASITNTREIFIDLEWQQDINIAIDIANVQGAFYTQQHPQPVVKIENRPETQFALDLFDIVEVNLAAIGLSYATYRVGGLSHETIKSESCQSVLSTFWLEPYISAGDYMQWDTASIWDTDTVFGW